MRQELNNDLGFNQRLQGWATRGAEIARERYQKRKATLEAMHPDVPPKPCSMHPDILRPFDEDETIRRWRDEKAVPLLWFMPCPQCVDDRERLLPKLRWARKMGVPDAYFGATLDDLRIPETHRDMLEGFQNRPEGFLILLGPPGTGKTHASLAILQARGAGFFTSHSRLLSDHRRTYRDDGAPDVKRRAMDAKLLVIDEVGRSVGGGDAEAMMHDILDARYAEGRPTIILSNLTREGLRESIGGPISDRIRGSLHATIQFSGDSNRGKDLDGRNDRLAVVRRLDAIETPEDEE